MVVDIEKLREHFTLKKRNDKTRVSIVIKKYCNSYHYLILNVIFRTCFCLQCFIELPQWELCYWFEIKFVLWSFSEINDKFLFCFVRIKWGQTQSMCFFIRLRIAFFKGFVIIIYLTRKPIPNFCGQSIEHIEVYLNTKMFFFYISFDYSSIKHKV